MTTAIHNLLRSERGNDLIKCFYDMSLKDACIICNIGYSTMREIKGKLGMQKWNFRDLSYGRTKQDKWEEIKRHREAIIKVFHLIFILDWFF